VEGRPDVAANAARILAAIAAAAGRAGREASEVTIVAAAKRVVPAAIEAAADAGITAIGENYVGELRDARAAVTRADVRWHYLGALQTGTAHHVADLADVVETVAGERAARRLAGRALRGGRELDVLLEVDFTGERTGLDPADVAAAAATVAAIEGLRPRGLMTVPPDGGTAEAARPWFARLRELRDDLARRHPSMLELSMGMSLDYEVAVEEGATMVRIGTALFGPRAP